MVTDCFQGPLPVILVKLSVIIYIGWLVGWLAGSYVFRQRQHDNFAWSFLVVTSRTVQCFDINSSSSSIYGTCTIKHVRYGGMLRLACGV